MRKTALITGASSGIGKEFARVFAKMGYRLILTARRIDRLEELKRELNVPCKLVIADLREREQIERLELILEDEKIDVFINNAGLGTCGEFLDTDMYKELSMIDVNVTAMHMLFKVVLKNMEKHGTGRILNVASSAGLLPGGPFMATYYATKSYVVSLTLAVAEELRQRKSRVYVAALCPGPVDTEFNEKADVKFALPGITPKECVKAALVGMRKRETIIVPTKLLKIGMKLQGLLPKKIILPIVAMQQKKKY